MTRRILSIGLTFWLLAVGGVPVLAQESGQRAETTVIQDTTRHAQFSRLLTHYVDEEGHVDYVQLKRDADSVLVPYLHRLAEVDPTDWTRDARLAFWINAYNAYALKLIIDHYPVPTIWATTPGPAKPSKENSPFGIKLGTVADTTRTLDEIEHEIIRDRFDEPRIHFAVVCAAVSCPRLRQEAYTGRRLDAQLDDQARTFLHDESKNRIPAEDDRIALSRILKWYGQDFGLSPAAVQQALAGYFEGRVRERLSRAEYRVDFLPYDWSLNDQKNDPASSE